MATLATIRKQIDAQAATDTRKILDLFIKIAETNPQAVIDVMGNFAKQRNPEMMVTFYKENAGYLKAIFDYS